MLFASMSRHVSMLLYTVDIDECRLDPELCQPGLCKNTYGSYYCECQQGYAVKPGTTACSGHNTAGWCIRVCVQFIPGDVPSRPRDVSSLLPHEPF